MSTILAWEKRNGKYICACAREHGGNVWASLSCAAASPEKHITPCRDACAGVEASTQEVVWNRTLLPSRACQPELLSLDLARFWCSVAFGSRAVRLSAVKELYSILMVGLCSLKKCVLIRACLCSCKFIYRFNFVHTLWGLRSMFLLNTILYFQKKERQTTFV